jgi:replicative DNA helicase
MDNHFDINSELNIIYTIGYGSNHTPRVFRELHPDDFFDTGCQTRFAAYHKAYQIGQLAEFSKQKKDLLIKPDGTIPLWDAVNTVRNHAIRRKIEKAMYDVAEKCRDYSEDITELQGELKAAVMEAIDTRACKAPSVTKDDLVKVVDGMENMTAAFYTGLEAVDNNAPIQHGDFVMICARPGVGKSALSTGMIMSNFLGNDKRSGIFFCIEMDARQNYARISSQMCRVPLTKYINSRNNPPTKGELNSIMGTIDTISEEFPERWFVEGAVSLDEITDMTEIYKPDFIVVDYVQIVKTSGEGHEKLAKISTALRMLALEKRVAVIAIAQLNRDASGAVPVMSQIKGSGQFEQDATHIFLLDRPESERMNKIVPRHYFNKQGNEVNIFNPTIPTDKAALICSKNRNGPPFYSLLNFDPQTTSFTEDKS